MREQYDDVLWQEAFDQPDWYLHVIEQFMRLEALSLQEPDYEKRKLIKGPMYRAVATALSEKRIPLATSGEDNDLLRKPIDMVVLHHTKNPPGMPLDLLNGEQLLRLYATYYAHPSIQDQHIKGQPIWSGHFYKEQQVFWAYHWLIREDGTAEHILKDEYIGWHAGNYPVNCRSVAICIDNDLSSQTPNDQVLEAIAQIICTHYPHVLQENLVGHCDVNKHTRCPGDLFHEVWRAHLLARLAQRR